VNKAVFLDTAYAIALSVPKDNYHQQALSLADKLDALGIHMVTTEAILLEIGNALSKHRYRQAAVELLEAIELDPLIEIVPMSGELYVEAFRLYRERPDKEWGLTDCISFIVMNERGIRQALTTDDHFRQAGFEALLLHTSR
jgi:uncharacterized protein